MGFIDELKRLARPYEDEEVDDFDDFEPVGRGNVAREKVRDREAASTLYDQNAVERRSNKVVNIHTTTQLQVVLVKPDRFEQASEIADHLREKRTVVLNLESTQKMCPVVCWYSCQVWLMPTRARSRRSPFPLTSLLLIMWIFWAI